MDEKPLLQVREAARLLGVHENTMRRWDKSGLIRAVRLPSGIRRFRAEDVELLRAQMYAHAGSGAQDAAVAAAARSLDERSPAAV